MSAPAPDLEFYECGYCGAESCDCQACHMLYMGWGGHGCCEHCDRASFKHTC